eukprot:Opistho-2@34894
MSDSAPRQSSPLNEAARNTREPRTPLHLSPRNSPRNSVTGDTLGSPSTPTGQLQPGQQSQTPGARTPRAFVSPLALSALRTLATAPHSHGRRESWAGCTSPMSPGRFSFGGTPSPSTANAPLTPQPGTPFSPRSSLSAGNASTFSTSSVTETSAADASHSSALADGEQSASGEDSDGRESWMDSGDSSLATSTSGSPLTSDNDDEGGAGRAGKQQGDGGDVQPDNVRPAGDGAASRKGDGSPATDGGGKADADLAERKRRSKQMRRLGKSMPSLVAKPNPKLAQLRAPQQLPKPNTDLRCYSPVNSPIFGQLDRPGSPFTASANESPLESPRRMSFMGTRPQLARPRAEHAEGGAPSFLSPFSAIGRRSRAASVGLDGSAPATAMSSPRRSIDSTAGAALAGQSPVMSPIAAPGGVMALPRAVEGSGGQRGRSDSGGAAVSSPSMDAPPASFANPPMSVGVLGVPGLSSSGHSLKIELDAGRSRRSSSGASSLEASMNFGGEVQGIQHQLPAQPSTVDLRELEEYFGGEEEVGNGYTFAARTRSLSPVRRDRGDSGVDKSYFAERCGSSLSNNCAHSSKAVAATLVLTMPIRGLWGASEGRHLGTHRPRRRTCLRWGL